MVCSSLSMIQTMCWIILLDRKTFFFISHEYNENSENQFLSNHLFFCVKIPWFSAAQQAVHWTNIHKLNSRWRHFCMTSSPYSENILNKKPMFALQNALLYQSLQVAYIYFFTNWYLLNNVYQLSSKTFYGRKNFNSFPSH